MTTRPGTLYIVATPIGNLDDVSARSITILSSVDVILAEDTRHSRKLLNKLAIKTPLISCHEHNEDRKTPHIIGQLGLGLNVALICDAGTPLISDPGFKLVRQAHREMIPVSPVPGPCALIAALSASGLPSHPFTFEGFLPEKPLARRKRLNALMDEGRTMIFYESPHRIQSFLDDAAAILGGQRHACIARELTKKFETIKSGRLSDLIDWMNANDEQARGEFVVIISAGKDKRSTSPDLGFILKTLLKSLTLKQSVQIASELSGRNKNAIYDLALDIQQGISADKK